MRTILVSCLMVTMLIASSSLLADEASLGSPTPGGHPMGVEVAKLNDLAVKQLSHPVEYYDLGSPTPGGCIAGVEVADFDFHYYDLGSPTPGGYVMGVEVADLL